jgi:hypothetical protein
MSVKLNIFHGVYLRLTLLKGRRLKGWIFYEKRMECAVGRTNTSKDKYYSCGYFLAEVGLEYFMNLTVWMLSWNYPSFPYLYIALNVWTLSYPWTTRYSAFIKVLPAYRIVHCMLVEAESEIETCREVCNDSLRNWHHPQASHRKAAALYCCKLQQQWWIFHFIQRTEILWGYVQIFKWNANYVMDIFFIQFKT